MLTDWLTDQRRGAEEGCGAARPATQTLLFFLLLVSLSVFFNPLLHYGFHDFCRPLSLSLFPWISRLLSARYFLYLGPLFFLFLRLYLSLPFPFSTSLPLSSLIIIHGPLSSSLFLSLSFPLFLGVSHSFCQVPIQQPNSTHIVSTMLINLANNSQPPSVLPCTYAHKTHTANQFVQVNTQQSISV